jgi:polyisoprenoid-binding protein YceI
MSVVETAMHFDRDGRHVALPGELTIKGVTRPILLDGELRGSAHAFALKGAGEPATGPESWFYPLDPS